MFDQIFGQVRIQTVAAPKRGLCLQASCGEAKILMDFCGMNPTLVPDGTNAYFFGNKLIVVTRWSDMTDDEKETVETAKMILAVHPYKCAQLSLKVGANWGDAMVTLPHCYDSLNDESKPVDEIIFIFADTHDSDYLISREVALPSSVQNFFQRCNINSHEILALDDKLGNIEMMASTDKYKDFYDYLYDMCWEKTRDFFREARSKDLDNIPGGIYIEIDSANKVTNAYQNEFEKQSTMSNEVKMYLELAKKGIFEAQYNLGVCYEQGDGIAQDFEQALYWYAKAAEQGYAKAQYNLGILYYNGCGTEADHVKAAKLFELSAEQGDMYAQYNMGVCCYTGDGVETDISKGIEWFMKAAEQGHPEAKKILGQK